MLKKKKKKQATNADYKASIKQSLNKMSESSEIMKCEDVEQFHNCVSNFIQYIQQEGG